ncbi:MAG: hypothetical protein AAGJ08_28665 [Cyanobacteria bacterium P01_H01_bin.35]
MSIFWLVPFDFPGAIAIFVKTFFSLSRLGVRATSVSQTIVVACQDVNCGSAE